MKTLLLTLLIASSFAVSSQDYELLDFTDSRNGEVYRTARISGLTWMMDNLNFETSNSACYGGNPANCQNFGMLYTIEEARNACPEGWRLPTSDELLAAVLTFVELDYQSEEDQEVTRMTNDGRKAYKELSGDASMNLLLGGVGMMVKGDEYFAMNEAGQYWLNDGQFSISKKKFWLVLSDDSTPFNYQRSSCRCVSDN